MGELALHDLDGLRRAIDAAHRARNAGNHPFGAVIRFADGSETVAENRVASDGDLTAHAELVALRELGSARQASLGTATLYASTEPCLMCTGALYWTGIRRVVYGVSQKTLARLVGAEMPEHMQMVRCAGILPASGWETTVLGPYESDDALAVHDGFWESLSATENSGRCSPPDDEARPAGARRPEM